MANTRVSGFNDTQTSYLADNVELVGQIRRFGTAGPAYEILRMAAPEHVAIHVIQSGEMLDYPISEALRDPVAETIP